MSSFLIVALALYFSCLGWFAVFGIHRLRLLWSLRKAELPRKTDPLDEFPTVVIQLPVYNEPQVVERLLLAVVALDYPAELLEIQLLDDSTDETSEIAQRVIAELKIDDPRISHIRRKNRLGFKAGALEEGLARSEGEFVFILDADFVPAPGVLRELISDFQDPKVGMVQARWGHLNAEQNLLARLQVILLDGHFRIEQPARFAKGHFFNFNGTAGVWRRRCIEEAGGWSHDTVTEDLDLSYRAQLAGWRFIYRDDLEIPAELPPTMGAFRSQQFRWAKGAIQTCRKLFGQVWRSSEGIGAKLEASAHLLGNFSYLILGCLIALQAVTLIAGWREGMPGWVRIIEGVLVGITMSSILAFYTVALMKGSGEGWGNKAYRVLGALILGAGLVVLGTRAVVSGWFQDGGVFVRTPKTGGVGGSVRKGGGLGKWVLSIWGECLVMSWVLSLAIWAISLSWWAALPFLLLFLVGLGYVSGLLFRELLGTRRTSTL